MANPEPSSRNRTTKRGEEAEQPLIRFVIRDPGTSSESRRGGGPASHTTRQDVTDRRLLRFKYLAVKHLINDERDNISQEVSDKFNSIINQVENLHHLVQNPREQIADAEALLDIANTIVDSVKSQTNDGITPSDFITSLLRDFPPRNGQLTMDNLRDSMAWGKLGGAVSHILNKFPGYSTMLGPMNVELKQRKASQRKRVKPAQSSCPEEIEDNGAEEKTDTDKNMATMFNILRKKKSVKLEHLVLSRISFAQTVENLFALSFLVKDGRVAITVNSDGHHLVWPRNAPPATAVASGDVSYCHFVLRFDYKDWKLMMDLVQNGEELMPHRTKANAKLSSDTQGELVVDSQGAAPTTPIRKLCRNRGLVIQEELVVEDSPEDDNASGKGNAIQKGKRKFG